MKNPYTRPTEGVIKLKNGSTTEESKGGLFLRAFGKRNIR